MVLSVTSSIVDMASRISSSSFKFCFRKLLSELCLSKTERLSITSRCLCLISLIITSTDLPFETIHFVEGLLYPPMQKQLQLKVHHYSLELILRYL